MPADTPRPTGASGPVSGRMVPSMIGAPAATAAVAADGHFEVSTANAALLLAPGAGVPLVLLVHPAATRPTAKAIPMVMDVLRNVIRVSLPGNASFDELSHEVEVRAQHPVAVLTLKSRVV